MSCSRLYRLKAHNNGNDTAESCRVERIKGVELRALATTVLGRWSEMASSNPTSRRPGPSRGHTNDSCTDF